VLNGLNGVPRTSEDGSAAHEAATKLQMDTFDPLEDRQEANRRVQEEGGRVERIVTEYWHACHEWYAKYGQELVKQPELAKVIWERARENDGQESSPSL
jgi:hypothetical protein